MKSNYLASICWQELKYWVREEHSRTGGQCSGRDGSPSYRQATAWVGTLAYGCPQVKAKDHAQLVFAKLKE